MLADPPNVAPAFDAAGTVVPSLTLKRRLKAAPAKVYAAWTKAEQLAAWFGPGPVLSASAEIDLRVGGRFTARFQSADGTQNQVGGLYQEIEPDRKLVFTWAWHSTPERESRVTVLLKPDGAGTLLTLIHEKFFDAPARDGHSRGWAGALDKFVLLVEQDANPDSN